MKGLDPMPSVEDGSFDDLLGEPISPEEKKDIADLKDNGEPAETADEARIRQLEEQIAALTAEAKAAPEEKSAEQKAMEHNKAIQLTKQFNSAPEQFESIDEDDPSLIVFHILSSGFTFAGKVWWVGQTVKVKRDGQAYKDTVDRNGDSWLDDLSVQAQRSRWGGKIMVAEGPYTGPAFNDAISKLDAFRQGAAPVVSI